MVGKYKVITLCGSTRFKDEFMKSQKDLTLLGDIVINVGGYIGIPLGVQHFKIAGYSLMPFGRTIN